MADYKSIYLNLFNAVTDAISLLQTAQLETEEEFINQDENNIRLLKEPEDPK